jgi:hypothetical protein
MVGIHIVVSLEIEDVNGSASPPAHGRGHEDAIDPNHIEVRLRSIEAGGHIGRRLGASLIESPCAGQTGEVL